MEESLLPSTLEPLLARAIAFREPMLDPKHQGALRLFNGHLEGCPALVVDLYATTLVVHNYADPPATGEPLVALAQQIAQAQLPWITAVVVKTRQGATPEERRGQLVFGAAPDRRIREHGVAYALDLLMNRDASFYLDTRNLRRWALDNLQGRSVLNTFAYTGSLGVAAQAAGAARVVHLDLNRAFLNVAKTSYTLNGFPIRRPDFVAGDFWPVVNRMKRAAERFDCVFLDPPFFAATDQGVVDLERNIARLINKVRPLVRDGGTIVAINNALFFGGQAYLDALQSVCRDGYVSLGEPIPVPPDCAGFPETRVGAPITDPAPFNHSTKIAVLHVRHTPPDARASDEDDR